MREGKTMEVAKRKSGSDVWKREILGDVLVE